MIAFENFENIAGQPNSSGSHKTLEANPKSTYVPIGSQLAQNQFILMADFLEMHGGVAPPLQIGQ